MKTVSATEMKNRLGVYLQMIMAEPIIVEKAHRPVAVLLSKEEYERLTKLEDAYWGEKAKAAETEGYLTDAETRDFVEASIRVEA